MNRPRSMLTSLAGSCQFIQTYSGLSHRWYLISWHNITVPYSAIYWYSVEFTPVWSQQQFCLCLCYPFSSCGTSACMLSLFFLLQREDSTYLIGMTKGCFRSGFKLLETCTKCFHKASKTHSTDVMSWQLYGFTFYQFLSLTEQLQ